MDAIGDLLTTLLTILVVVVVVIGQIPGGLKLLAKLLGRVLARFGVALAPGTLGEVEQEDAEVSAQAQQFLAQAQADFVVLRSSHAKLTERAEQTRTAGPTPVLRDALNGMATRHESLVLELAQAARAQAASALEPQRAYALDQSILWEQARLSAADAMLAMRQDPATAEMLADADAVAMALLAPLAHFADTYQISLPRRRPITVLAAPDEEAIWFGLLPAEYPMVFVPQGFDADIHRWVSLPHELGHLLWRAVPGLANEIRSATRLNVAATPAASGPNVTGAYAAWLEELFCDSLATLQLGPAAVRGALFALAANLSADETAAAGLVSDGQRLWFEEHPPVRLRLALMLHLLHLMGYGADRLQLQREVEHQIGPGEHYGIPDLGQQWNAVPAEAIEAPGRELVEHLYHSQWGSLAGFPLAAIPGLALTPGRSAQVRQTAAQFASGEPATGDPVLLVAAALEARRTSSTSPRRIANLVNRSIQGIDEPAALGPRIWSEAPAPPETPAPVGKEALEALLIDELLSRRGGLAAPTLVGPQAARRLGIGIENEKLARRFRDAGPGQEPL